MRAMKTIRSITKILVILFIIVVVIPFVGMIYCYKSQENTAKDDCAKFIIGAIYDKSIVNKDVTHIYRKNSELSYYSYIYPLSFDEGAECIIYTDSKNKIIKKYFNIR
jgi:hypothetical protein